ncbi:EAL domain-containing protein [Acetobacter sp. AN02]|nr:EAL domain-containing protein [Acetobacter sp. AN02]
MTLDDFGTGYSSFGFLRNYPVESLKIDCDSTKDMMQETSIRAIVESIVRLGKALSLNVIAEGLETEEQYSVLREFGCPVAQGFLFGSARPTDTVAALLESGKQTSAGG